MSMGGARREIRRLRDKLRAEDKDFRAAAPPVDADGLPDWTGDSLSVESYSRLLDGGVPDEELSEPEREARQRLSPYREVFSRLDATEEDEP